MPIFTNKLSGKFFSFSYKNDISNPDFSNGTTSWSASASTINVSDNVLTNTGTGSAIDPRIFQPPSITYSSGKKLYVSALVLVTNSVCSSLSIRITSSGMSTVSAASISNPVQDVKYTLSGVGTLGSGGTLGNALSFLVRQAYADSATANGKIMKVEKVMLIDLTSLYGAGNEPSAADCASIFRFVDGNSQPNFSTQIVT